MSASLARATVPSMSESCASAVEPQRLLRRPQCATHREVERHNREACILGIGGGTTEIMAELLGL
jgi:alkylation response protein AidB-like acyl-CoA dehydrogenase